MPSEDTDLQSMIFETDLSIQRRRIVACNHMLTFSNLPIKTPLEMTLPNKFYGNCNTSTNYETPIPLYFYNLCFLKTKRWYHLGLLSQAIINSINVSLFGHCIDQQARWSLANKNLYRTQFLLNSPKTMSSYASPKV